MSLKAEWSIRAVLCVLSILFAVAVLEIGCRLWRGPGWLVAWPNLVAQERSGPLADMWRAFAYDPVSGYAPRPRFVASGLHTDDDGFRIVVGRTSPSPDRALILAVGDSFVMGADVPDSESWPAQLEILREHRVVNAGVPGYSLAQSVLRAEALAARLGPLAVVVGFIADDIRRGAFSRRLGMEMPYFAPADDGIVLANAPPSPVRDDHATLTPFQRLFGWSMLIDTVVRRTGKEVAWFADRRRALSMTDAERAVCPMMRRLAALAVPTLVVAQYDDDAWSDDAAVRAEERRLARYVLDCAAAAGLPTVDLLEITDAAIRNNGFTAVYGQGGHHTLLGNRLAADAIDDALSRLVGR